VEVKKLSAPCNPPTYSFSTEGIAQDQRFEAWREETSAMFEMSSPSSSDVSYDSSFDFTALGELMFGGRSWLQPAKTVVHGMARSARKIRADGLDAYYLQLQIGETIQGYAGRTASQVNPGGICVLDLASPFDLEVTTGDTICMVIPRDNLPSCVAGLHGLSLSGGMANILSVSGVFSTLRRKREDQRSAKTAYRRNAARPMTASQSLAIPSVA